MECLIPKWAKRIIWEETFNKVVVEWVVNHDNTSSYGFYTPGGEIEVFAPVLTTQNDQTFVLLHEIAHYLVYSKYKTVRPKRQSPHGKIFAEQAADLYAKYGIIDYAATRATYPIERAECHRRKFLI